MHPVPNRKPTRARGFDYREPGPYFVSICTQHRVHQFGQVVDNRMQLDAAGIMVHEFWQQIPSRFPGVILDVFMVMPNHLHALITLNVPELPGLDGAVALSDIIGWFKTQTTRRYIQGVRTDGWSPFDGHLWQRSYHDEIVRTERGMQYLRGYILDNPRKWLEDALREVEPAARTVVTPPIV